MTDRFDAQLRQHLLTNADDRAAEGQLADILASVAGTSQRHPLAARLTWVPGRIGPVPTRAVRLGLVAVAVALALVATIILAGGLSHPRSTVFEGTWTSIDPADDSRQVLIVEAGTAPRVHFTDEFASGDACVDDIVKVFTAEGTGEVTDERLQVAWPQGGGCGLFTVPVSDGTFRYDAPNRRLIDAEELVWLPVSDLAAIPTRGAPAVPSASPGSPPTSKAPDCTEFPDGGTYRAPGTDVLLEVTVPAVADSTWSGRGESFHLERASCGSGGSVWIDASIMAGVPADACHRNGSTLDGGTPEEIIVGFAAQLGHDTSPPIEISLDAGVSTLIDVSVPEDFDPTDCTSGTIELWDGVTIAPGQSVRVLVAPFGGALRTLRVTQWTAETTPGMIQESNGIVASLRLNP